MKEKFSIQNIIIIVLLITIVALLVEPKLKSNTISGISDEISTDSTTIDDTLSMRDWLLNKGYSEKEIKLVENKELHELNLEGEIGRYQLQLIQPVTGNFWYDQEFIVLDTKTGDIYRAYWSDVNNTEYKLIVKRIKMATRFK